MSAPPSLALETLGASEIRSAASNAPLLLDDPGMAWRVVDGQLDVFVVPVSNGVISGSREFLYQAEAGDVLFGCPPGDDGVALVAVGGADSAVAPITTDDLRALQHEQPRQCAAIFDRYVRTVSNAFAVRGAPRIDVMAETAEDLSLPPGSVLGARRDVLWIGVQKGFLQMLSEDTIPLTVESAPFPLAPGAWLSSDEESGTAKLRATTTASLLASGAIWDALAEFQTSVLAWAALVLSREDVARLSQLRSRIEADQGAHRDAITSMASVMTSGQQRADRKKGIPLLAAMEMVGQQIGMKFRSPGSQFVVTDPYGAARSIAHTSSVGQRRVMLTPGWWKRDVGPLLGFLELRQISMDGSSSGHDDIELLPVALLPARSGTYEIVNPEDGSRSTVTEQLAQHLAAFGVQFYRGLPNARLGLKDLWRFAMFGLRDDARLVLAMGAAGALLGLVLPLLTAYLFDEVIPSADAPALVNVFVALVVTTLASAAFGLTSTMAVLRLHTRMGSALQMAVIDRLLRLPATFYRKYTVGDLGQRAFGINTIGNHLGTTTISAALSSFVSVGSFALLVYYSVPLAMLALGLLGINIAVSAIVARLILVDTREYQEASGKLSGLVLQLLDGIAKLRVSATEARAFARWSAAFRRQQAVAFKVGVFSMNVAVFHAVLGIASTLVIYGFYARMASTRSSGLSTGEFLAFSAAFGTFIAAATSLSETALSILRLVPTWERARPVLDTEPEVDFFKPDPGELTGHIEVSQVSFSYTSGGPMVLHDVSLEAKPGEFIALVGPSGSGKSTLLRILLGFERQQGGTIRFDGHDTATVDINAVRRQIGVVLQNSSLSAGDIFSNIVGASAFTLDDAWEAARMAGLEEDLRAMPMGMHTVISEGGGVLSGGQRQRLLIARSLVARPRILFFDEATSALDNRTQRIVSASVDRLHATRIVLAHRLSTIRNADRIFVMEAGRLVESGTYESLMEQGGLFASMAARQEA